MTSTKEYERITNELLAEISSSTQSDLVNQFIYLGFDPKIIAEEMSKIAAQNQRVLSKDVMTLVTAAVVRGVNSKKMTNKMSEEGVKVLTELFSVYAVQRTSQGQGRKVISLGRIMATFPQAAALVIAKNPGCNMRLSMLSELPEYLAFPGSNALIPRSDPMQQEYVKFAKAFSKLVRSQQSEDDQNKFIEITKHSPVIGPDDMRAAVLRQIQAKTFLVKAPAPPDPSAFGVPPASESSGVDPSAAAAPAPAAASSSSGKQPAKSASEGSGEAPSAATASAPAAASSSGGKQLAKSDQPDPSAPPPAVQDK